MLSRRLPGPGAPPSANTKRVLFRAGALASPRAIYGLLGLFNYLHLGWWFKHKRFEVCSQVADRSEVFRRIADECVGQRVLYLEFGVAEGASLREWAELLRSTDSMLHGFDSFEGLPSNWGPAWEASSFSRAGKIPPINDPRVKLFPGWFNETLPAYEWPEEYDRLVVTLDADLYSSTAYVLGEIEAHVVPGTVVYFDEFHHYADELRAFDEFLQRTGWRFEVLAATEDFSRVAFRRVT